MSDKGKYKEDIYNHWKIVRYYPKSKLYTKKWKVIDPADPCSDYIDMHYFHTFEEAMYYAWRCATTRKIESFVTEMLDKNFEKVMEYMRIIHNYRESFLV